MSVDAARRFLRMYLFDSDLTELEATVRRGSVTTAIADGVRAIERLLVDDLPAWTLLGLVEIDANWPLDDATDDGARAFLTDLVAKLRAWLGDKAPAGHG